MTKEYDNTNTGTLFKNDREGKSANFPEYGGSLNVDGQEFWISAWVKDGKKGKFFSLAIKPKEARGESKPAPRGGGGGSDGNYDDSGDTIPFVHKFSVW
jgi:hypothetical protein